MKKISSSLRSRRTILLQLALIIGVAISAIAFQSYAAGGFNQPSVGAPGGNAYAPINVGANMQTKLGGLGLGVTNINKIPSNAKLFINGNTIISNGNVGIGTTNPTSKLDVNGTVEVAQNIGTGGFSPTAGIPTGWGGGVHTWDVYAEGTVGVGKNGEINAYLNNAGDIWAKNSISAPSIAANDITAKVTMHVSKIVFPDGTVQTTAPKAATVAAPVPVLLPGPSTFNYTGFPQTYTVTSNVHSVQIKTWGAQGGNLYFAGGGKGGYATGILAVNPGENLQIKVGGQNGFNGGGGGSGTTGTTGGGASDVRVNGVGLGNRVIVAAGGGGAADGSSSGGITAGGGGAGGGYYGVIGGGSIYSSFGGGATPTAGGVGAGSGSWGGAADGSSGYGGAGSFGGGGGGGGYYGGGGGLSVWNANTQSSYGGGGGGGSSYTGKVTSGSTQTGVRAGNGMVKITPIN